MNHSDISYNSLKTNYFDVKEYTWGTDITTPDLLEIMDDLDKPIVIRDLFKNTKSYSDWNIENIANVFDNIKLNTNFKVNNIDSLCKWFENNKKMTIDEILEYYKEGGEHTDSISINDSLIFNSQSTPHCKVKNKNQTKKQILNSININGVDSVVFDKTISTQITVSNNAYDEMKMNGEFDFIVSQLFGETEYYLCEIKKNYDIIKEKNIKDIICNRQDNDYRFPSHYIENNEKKYNFFELDHSLFNDLYKVKLNPGDTILIPPNWWYSNKNNGITTHITRIESRTNYNFVLDHPNILLNYYFSDTFINYIHFIINKFKYQLIIILLGFIIAIYAIITTNNYKFITIPYIYSTILLFIIIILPILIKYIFTIFL